MRILRSKFAARFSLPAARIGILDIYGAD
jgi:hypothetical protein